MKPVSRPTTATATNVEVVEAIEYLRQNPEVEAVELEITKLGTKTQSLLRSFGYAVLHSNDGPEADENTKRKARFIVIARANDEDRKRWAAEDAKAAEHNEDDNEDDTEGVTVSMDSEELQDA